MEIATIASIINFLLFVTIIYALFYKNLQKYFHERHSIFSNIIEEADTKLFEARINLASSKNMYKNADEDAEELERSLNKQSDIINRGIIKTAEEDSIRVINNAKAFKDNYIKEKVDEIKKDISREIAEEVKQIITEKLKDKNMSQCIANKAIEDAMHLVGDRQ